MSFEATVEVGKHTIGPGHRAFLIAEMSGNHNGSLDRALDIVERWRPRAPRR